MLKNKILFISACAAATLLSGCANQQMEQQVKSVYNTSKHTINKSLSRVHKSKKFTVNKGKYSNDKFYDLQKAWQRKKVEVHAYQQPLADIMNILTQGSNVSVSYNDKTNLSLININYKGTVAGALHQLMMKNNLYYSIQGSQKNTIQWSATQTKTFNIAYLPGTTSFNLGGSSTSSSSDSPNSNNSTSSLKGNVSVWGDIEKSINLLLSAKGKIIVNQSSGTITVNDKPLNIEKISKVVAKFNATLSKRVIIRIKILEVQLNKQHQYGIDWNIVYKGVSLANLSGNALTSIASLSTGQNSTSSKSNWAGTAGLINALDKQGKTAIVDEPTITSLNNLPSTISVTDKKAYIKSIETTTSGYGLDPVTNYTVNPANVITGLKMTLIPHIQDGKVYLSIDGSLSTLQNLTNVSVGAQGSANAISIQLPETNAKAFNQRVMVPNNHVIVLSGLRTSNNKYDQSKNFQLGVLGSNSDQINNKELVVLIEPTIIGQSK